MTTLRFAVALTFLAIVTVVLAAQELIPGVSALREFDIDIYANFNTKDRRRDGWEGHELLQHGWLLAHEFTVVRNEGVASRENPAIAVRRPMHRRITLMQQQAGLHDPARLAVMSGDENIAINADIAHLAGVWPHAVFQAMIAWEAHLALRVSEWVKTP